MCGIVGFTGNHQAAPILLDGLSKLEYRGYVLGGEQSGHIIFSKHARTGDGRADNMCFYITLV